MEFKSNWKQTDVILPLTVLHFNALDWWLVETQFARVNANTICLIIKVVFDGVEGQIFEIIKLFSVCFYGIDILENILNFLWLTDGCINTEDDFLEIVSS